MLHGYTFILKYKHAIFALLSLSDCGVACQSSLTRDDAMHKVKQNRSDDLPEWIHTRIVCSKVDQKPPLLCPIKSVL